MPLVQVDGIELYYEEAGSGPPLLLINGLGGSTLGWTPLLPPLVERHRVIVFDNRGSGRSAAPPGPYTTRQMADDTAALMERIGLARAHVMGLSLGGMIAQELAIAHPERVDRLVLLATFARPVPAIHEPWIRFFVQAHERQLDPAGLAFWTMPWFLTPAFMTRYDLVEAAIAEALNDPYPAPPHGFAAQAAAGLGHDAVDRLPKIAAPTLVLVGAEDIITPVECSRELAEGIPSARLQVLDRGGHVPFLEYPEAVAAALLSFLAE